MKKPVMVCKECFPKRYGEISEMFFDIYYILTEDERICEMCGKKKKLVLRKSNNGGKILMLD